MSDSHTQMPHVLVGSHLDLCFDFLLLHELVEALLHVKELIAFLGQHFLHGSNRFKPENLVLVFLGFFLYTDLVALNLKYAQAILAST